MTTLLSTGDFVLDSCGFPLESKLFTAYRVNLKMHGNVRAGECAGSPLSFQSCYDTSASINFDANIFVFFFKKSGTQ